MIDNITAFSITLKVDALSILIKNVTLSRIANIITTLSITLKCEDNITTNNIAILRTTPKNVTLNIMTNNTTALSIVIKKLTPYYQYVCVCVCVCVYVCCNRKTGM
jgi:hypothetical protein